MKKTKGPQMLHNIPVIWEVFLIIVAQVSDIKGSHSDSISESESASRS